MSAELDIRPESMSVPNGAVPLPATREVVRRMHQFITTTSEPSSLPDILTQEGYVNVTSAVHLVPLGEWMDTERLREVGRLAIFAMVHLLHSLRPALLDQQGQGQTPQSIDNLLTQAEIELRAQTMGVSMPYHLVHATRP